MALWIWSLTHQSQQGTRQPSRKIEVAVRDNAIKTPTNIEDRDVVFSVKQREYSVSASVRLAVGGVHLRDKP